MRPGNLKPEGKETRSDGLWSAGKPPVAKVAPEGSGSRQGKPEPQTDLEVANREISRLTAELNAERMKRADAEQSLKDARREIESTTGCLEEAFGKANQMAIKAQIASIELNQIFNSSADGIWVLDKDFKILRVNDTLLKLLQRERAETVGQKCHAVFPGPNCRTPSCPMTRLSLGEPGLESDKELEQADGTRKFLLSSAAPFHGVDGNLFGIIEAYRDITDRKQAEEAVRKANEELKRLVAIDGLTQIANRRRFDECLQNEWRRMAREKKSLSLILCDLDFFKLYNDTYGHLSGDDCLRAVAQCVSEQAKRPSDLAARYGGEEFVVLLPNTDSEGGMIVAESILRGVAGLRIEHCRSAVAPHVTLSLGVTTAAPGSGASPGAFVSVADRALYEAKKQGRNRAILLVAP
jgi:diguanylate cyclase (GGDEF)-like protein/PAS domain S-box-containing protein